MSTFMTTNNEMNFQLWTVNFYTLPHPSIVQENKIVVNQGQFKNL
jgi:hypothetical protein